MIEAILVELSPQALRETVEMPHHRWRQEFEPRFVMTENHEEMMGELSRFMTHMQERWFRSSIPWPLERAAVSVRRILERKLGSRLHPHGGELAAMRICRHGENGGMRYLLDLLTEALIEQALSQYLDYHVLPKIYSLDPESSLQLAEEFLGTFGNAGGVELERPAGIALRWREVVHRHAEAMLRVGAPRAPRHRPERY